MPVVSFDFFNVLSHPEGNHKTVKFFENEIKLLIKLYQRSFLLSGIEFTLKFMYGFKDPGVILKTDTATAANMYGNYFQNINGLSAAFST